MIQPGEERLADYARDESHLEPHPPDCAVLCESRGEVALVLRLAREHRIPVTPRGAGSGKVGGALPVRGGVVLSTEAMRRIREVDQDDLVCVAEPGAITGDIQAAAEEVGLFYPPDPASLDFCSIGGNVACNAGGPRAFKYGVTRDYVLGLEVGLMGGELLRAGRRTSKGVSGYDLVGGFVGSEGTLGVTTEVTLKLLPKPGGVETFLAVFEDAARAGAAVSALLRGGFFPRTLEIADRTALDHVRPKTRFPFPARAGAIALVELDGRPEGLEEALIRAGQLCELAGALDVLVARDPRERRELWQARRLISPSLKEAHPHKISEDVCVPRGAVPEMLRRTEELGQRFEIRTAAYGHAGDGNLHVNLLVDADPRREPLAGQVERALTALFEAAVELGGTLSGEHGIGLAKRRFRRLEHAPALLEWERRVKRLWDPEGLLNPGKVLSPEEPRSWPE